jgi:hypothetical protein
MAERSKAAGYSVTPLVKKLGIGAGARVMTIGAPSEYRRLLAPLPAGMTFVRTLSSETDVVHLFTARRAELTQRLARLRPAIRPDTAVWVSWPKKASKVPTDVTEDVIREIALPLDFVDVKVCAVDERWSGLKLVIRKARRP